MLIIALFGFAFSFILLKESPCYEVYFKNLRQVLDNEKSMALSQAFNWLSDSGSHWSKYFSTNIATNFSDNLATN